jgi:Helix-loop-helix DNA-binding domain
MDSRLGTMGFEGMKLASNSPYSSQNQSTTSIQSSLQQQRNPGSGGDRLSAPRLSNSYQPNSARYGGDIPKQSRTAPTITGPATSAVANAAEPTKGQPWAFPDEPERMVPRSNGEITSRQTSYIGSRRSSNADSLASSQYTTESRLPQGQRRLEDGYPVDQQRLSRASSEFQGASHHHHSLQHRQIGDLRDEDAGSPGSGQPYSRTPELRISHKLAERKRRNEMKELYDELRDLMPQERGSKASKWEILSKGKSAHG